MATHNAKDRKVIVNGIPVTGFADGDDAISFVYDSDLVADTVGVTGEGAFSESNDRRGTLKLKLLATSMFNDVLSGLANGNIEFAAAMVDARGTSVGAGAACRVQKLPDQNVGSAVGVREWNIRCLEWVAHVGGTI